MAIQDTKVNYNPADPAQNIFAYGGNTIDAATGQKTPVSPVIDSNSLKPVSPLPYNYPASTPVPPVEGLTTEYTTPPLNPTPQENAATDFTRSIQALNDKLVGKSEYQRAQETAAGIPELQKTQTDLSTQLKELQNEAKVIPQQLQVEATGRGVTVGGLRPLETGRLRTNAIAALGVSSLLDATNGLLASAQSKADRAVAAKYDPIQAQIDAATKNLQLILNDPSTKLADKNRAQAQLDIQKQKQNALEKAKQDTKDVNAIAIEAAKHGASALTLQKIMQSKNQTEAIANAGNSIKTQPTTSITEVNGKKLLIDSKTGNTIKDLGAVTSKVTESAKTKTDVANMASELVTVTGQDGFISPENWKTALDAWVRAGNSVTSFVANFKNFANPTDTYVGL